MSMPMFTLRAIARELGLPESTVRYYRDAFADFLPAHGRGRRRRYPTEAVSLLRTIANGFADGRTREEIAAQLGDAGATVPEPSVAPVPYAVMPPVRAPGPEGELLTLVLDGERERREVMWQMAREIVRLGEAIERQHAVLGELAGLIERRTTRALPPPVDTNGVEAEARRAEEEALAGELDHLRLELDKERELVERLRRSKVDIERRAAEAEEALQARDQQRGFFRRGRTPPDTS